MGQIILEQMGYVPLNEAELNSLKQFENKINQNRNREIYLLAFEKEQ
ncbi:hypothetical protein V6C27_11260 [Peptococcaceae bacterium 1198_IL3148]